MEPIPQDSLEKALTINSIAIVFFHSKDVKQCEQVQDLLNDLSKQDDYKKAKFLSLEIGESTGAIERQFSVTSVPSVVIFSNGNEVDRVIGVNTTQLVQKVDKALEANRSIEQRLVSLINQEPVMVFIKGTPEQPRCGFTRTLVTLLNQLNVKYGSFDILSDQEVRQSLKLFSNWPTYPQLYVKGNLIGGLDIVQDLHENGELENMLKV